jgi:IS30 family transposase
MKKYTQLTMREREIIATMRQSKSSIAQIASCLQRSKSTISRELRRNQAPPGQYWPDTAKQQSLNRRKRGFRLDHHKLLKNFVTEKLTCCGWSPEQISGYLKTQQSELPYVCHETIYQWIYSSGQKSEKWFLYLTRHKKKRGMRRYKNAGAAHIKDRVSIHERDKEIEENQTIGHWEADLMACQKNTQFMLVLTERCTLYTLSVKLPNKTAGVVAHALITLLLLVPLNVRLSIAFDNGGEFGWHTLVKKAFPGLQTFFCDPYASWQKGRVENTNGRLRKDFPRWINLANMSKEDFDESIDNYNQTPRKCLNWQSPHQVLLSFFYDVALRG